MIDFIKENYKWIFSGIGIPILAFVIAALKKALGKAAARKTPQRELSPDIKNKKTLPPKVMTIIGENGTEETVEIILAFEFKDSRREYVVYTKKEQDKYGNTTVYVSEVDRSGGKPCLMGIPDEKEWKRVKDVLREIAESEGDQPIYDEYGIEII